MTQAKTPSALEALLKKLHTTLSYNYFTAKMQSLCHLSFVEYLLFKKIFGILKKRDL